MIFAKNQKSNIKRPKNKKAQNKKKLAKSAQQTIPYLMAYEDGMLELKKGVFSKSMLLPDINYQIARQDDQEDIFEKYCDFLNLFDTAVGLQITINNKSVNQEAFENRVLIEQKPDSLDEYRSEFNAILQKKISSGKNNIVKEKYLTLTIEEDNEESARDSFLRLDVDTVSAMREIGSNPSHIHMQDRLEIFHDIYRNGKEGEFTLNPVNPVISAKRKGISTKDLISPDSFEFKRDHAMIGDKYVRALFVKEIPTFLKDKVLSDLTDFRFNMLLSIHIKPINPEKAIRMVKKQILGMESNKLGLQKKGFKNGQFDAFIPHELRHSLEEAEEMLEDIVSKNQKLYLVSIGILHMADTIEQLNKDTKLIEAAARKNLCSIGKLNYQQEQGINSILPFGLNALPVDRCLTTESTAIFMPFRSQELLQRQGQYYGINPVSKNMLVLSRKNLKTPNGFILGTPGSGKSFAVKREMINVLLGTDDDVIIIDPEREYTELVKNFGGEVIHISANSKSYINPLDITEDYSDDDNPLLLKIDFIFSLFEAIIGRKEGLSAIEKSIIDGAIQKIYADLIQNSFAPQYMPTLKDLHKALKSYDQIEAQNLATALELYTTGNLSVFSNHTNIDVNNRLICYDIKDLGKSIKTMGMLITMDAIWNRITINRATGRRTWVYIDEAHLLFTNPYAEAFLSELWKRGRKWGAITTAITQNVEVVLASELARTMLSNSDFIMMLNQAASDRNELAKLLNISASQLNYITNSAAGSGLVFYGGSIIPFEDEFPKDTRLYKMMTTKVEEVTAIGSAKKYSIKGSA